MTVNRITSILSNTPLTLSSLHDEGVDIQIGCDGGVYDRDEFLAAVATELDVIAIDRADLPEVTDRGGLLTAINGPNVDTATTQSPAAALRARAHNLLALAEHLEAHPPIDEAQVDALAKSLMDACTAWDPSLSPAEIYHDFARRLVKAGVRAPQAGDDQ